MRAPVFLLCGMAAASLHAQRVATIFVVSPSSQIMAHDTAKLTATAYDSNGNPIPAAVFNWSVSSTAALTVDSSGTVSAQALGWADVYADSGGVRGTLRLQVIPSAINVKPANRIAHVGDTLQYSADVLDVNGQPLANVPIQWRGYGANGGTNTAIAITTDGVASTYGFGTFFIEAYYSYNVGGGPFLQQVYGNTLLNVQEPVRYSQTKLLDSLAVRQSFQLRPRRGQLSVNDSGQIAYVGWLEGFATAALTWKGGTFTPVAAAGAPAELPGSNLIDIFDPALNNNGEISARCIVAPLRNCMLFGAADGTSNLILFDGSGGSGVTNLRNFQTTRFGLNDSSVTLFRADYQDIGSTTLKTGLFTTTSDGRVFPAVAAGTSLPVFGTNYTFDTDFGQANDGTVLFYATSGSSRALFRMTLDGAITRVIGTGDVVGGSAILSLGNVAVGKNGQYATFANNGSIQMLLLFNGDPSKYSILPLNYYQSIYAVSGAGEAIFTASANNIFALYRWDGSSLGTVVTPGMPSPNGDLYTQIDSAGITAGGHAIAQVRTANNLLLVVDAGPPQGGRPTTLFQTGAQVPVPAGPAFYNFVLNSHTGNPMIKTGWYTADVFEFAGGSLLPRLINGDRMPDGWFYEGNQDVRRNGDGDLFVSTDQSITQISSAGGSTLLGHFPQRGAGGNLSTGFQLAANSSGVVAMAGGTNFGAQHISILSKGVATPIAYLNGPPPYRTVSPGGGFFAGSNDIGVDDNGTVYANLRVSGGSDGLFAYSGGTWSALLKVGDSYEGRPVTSFSGFKVAGTACYAVIQTTSGLSHLAAYRNGAWSDIVSYGDSIPTGGTVFFIGAFDANRNGAVAVMLNGNGGVQYLTYINGSDQRVAADSNHIIASTGELLVNYFQLSLNDDGRIFATAINDIDELVLYEFDPQ